MPNPQSRIPNPASRVLVIGVSARAMAESAARAGYEVTAIDAFGDLDLERCARALSLERDLGVEYSARAAARASWGVACDAVAYVSNFENHPRAVEAVARGEGRALWGNAPAVLARARNPVWLARTLGARGFEVPVTRASAPADRAGTRRAWLSKPRASGGGHGIAEWHAGDPLPKGRVLQERIAGVPGSVAFAADGRGATPFAVSRQLIGDGAFGAGGFKYCGSILAAAGDAQFDGDEALAERAAALAAAITEEGGLVGVNGVDFVARRGVPFPVEVNPRHSASMELAERAYDFSVFDAHARGCRGELVRFDLGAARRAAGGAVGKAVLYALRTVTLGDTRRWLEDESVRDVPHPEETIARGRPVCTVFACGRDDADCYAALVRRAEMMYQEIHGRGRRIA